MISDQRVGSGTPDHGRTDALVPELRSVRWALAVIAGLLGALAAQLIFVQNFLSALMGQGLTADNHLQVAGLVDLIGGLAFFILAAPPLGDGRFTQRRGRRP